MAQEAAKLNTKKPSAKTVKPSVTAEAPVKQLVRAHARSLRIAPRKMRLVTNLVKDMRYNDAMTQLSFTNKKGAKMLQKLLQSAAANAENNFSLNRDTLFIKELTCDMGPMLKRSFPRARGSAFMIRRKLSHVNVILEERAVKASKKKKAVVPKAVKPDVKEKELPVTSPVEPEIVDMPEAPHTPEPKVEEIHHENEADSVEQETSPQNLNK
jgi:large subunit ribosomal protein L22